MSNTWRVAGRISVAAGAAIGDGIGIALKAATGAGAPSRIPILFYGVAKVALTATAASGEFVMNAAAPTTYTSGADLGTFVFANDYPALLPEVPLTSRDAGNLFCCDPVRGECRVICFSPRHDLTLAQMPEPEILRVVDVWAEQVIDLGKNYPWVQLFENKGDAMGCSNPHPHGQVWARK